MRKGEVNRGQGLATGSSLAHSARLDRLLDPSVGSKDEKHRRLTSDQEQGSDGSDEPHRAFQEISTQDLIASARSVQGGTKVHVPDRVTAIVLLLGTRSLD